MKIAPIIHTRTFSSDFDPNIKVVPENFSGSDVNLVKKKILEATKSIDSLQGERWLIIDNDKYRIAGIIGFIKNICLQTNKKDDKSLETLFYDDKGRLVYAFIGIVIDKVATSEISSITYDMLWKYFEEKMNPIWKDSYQKQILSVFEEYEGKQILESEIAGKIMIDKKELYESNQKSDYDLFNRIVSDLDKSNFSLCTNIGDISAVKNCSFDIVTTNINIITRLRRECHSDENCDSNIKKAEDLTNESDSSTQETKSSDQNQKKNLLVWEICILIFLIIIKIVISII